MTRLLIDKIFGYLFKAVGIITILLLTGIFGMLLINSFSFFANVPIEKILAVDQWNPTEHYSIIPLLVSTFMVALGSMAIAIPLGILTAAYLSECAPITLKNTLKPLIEVLASIPSVAIGFLGIVLLGPALAHIFGLQNGLNALNGSILLAIMALPTIISVSEEAINAVPYHYKEASIGLGANKWQTLFKVTIPAALPGLIAATMLGLGRALGETMTVLMATGNASITPRGFLDSVRTITATIAIEMGEVPYQTNHYYSLFAIGLILFLITLSVNLLGEYIANNLRKYQS